MSFFVFVLFLSVTWQKSLGVRRRLVARLNFSPRLSVTLCDIRASDAASLYPGEQSANNGASAATELR